MFHNVNGDVRILEDIDSLITVSDTKGDVFQVGIKLSASATRLRTIRPSSSTCAIRIRIATLGTKLMLRQLNDRSQHVPAVGVGAESLWNGICKLHQDLESIRCYGDFDPRQRNRGAGRHEEALSFAL